MQETGKVVNVVHRRIGTTLDGDHPAGATELLVVNPVEFSDTAATLELPDETTAAYTGIDDDTNHVLLAAPTVADFADGDRIWVLPAAIDATAEVSDEEGGSVSVTIPHDSIDKLHEGPRDPGTEETVTYEPSPEGGWILVNVDKEIPSVDGEYIQEGTVPGGGGGPTAAPTGAPVLEVQPAAVGAVDARWTAVDDATWYDVYASTTPGVDADNPANRVLTGITSLRALIAAINDVQIPVDGSPTYVKVRAVNDLGAGPASNEASAAARQADAEFIAALMAYFQSVEAREALLGNLDVVMNVEVGGLISIGNRITIGDPDRPDGKGGIIIWGDDAHTVILAKLHPAGNYLDGILVAQEITVMKSLRLIGDLSAIASGARVKIENGVANPAKPTLTQGPLVMNFPATPAGYVARSIAWDAANSKWVQLLESTSDKRGRIRSITLDGNGAWVAGSLTVLPVGQYSGANGWTTTGVSGLTIIGTDVYYCLYVTSGDRFTQLLRVSGGAVTGDFGFEGDSTTVTRRSALANDGTHVYAIQGDETELEVLRFTAALSGAGSFTIEGQSANRQAIWAGLHVGAEEFGSRKIVLATGTQVHVHTPSAWPPPNSPATLAPADAANAWTTDAALSGGFGYKPTGDAAHPAGFYSLHGDGKITHWPASYPAANEKVWAQYADTNGANTTLASPESDGLLLGKRRVVTVALNPAPVGITGADVWVGYGTTSPGTTKKKRTETLVGRTMTLIQGKVTGSTAFPASNTLGGTPGELYDGFGNSWKGSGTVKLPGLVQPHTKRDSSGTQQSPTSGSVTKITTWGSVVDASTKIDNGVDDDIAYSAGDYTVRLGGLYLLAVGIRFTGNATGIRAAYIYKNGSTLLRVEQSGAVTGSAFDASASAVVRLAAGDVVHFSGLQNSGAGLAVVATGTTASITRLAA